MAVERAVWLGANWFFCVLLVLLALFCPLLFIASTQHLRIEARTDSVEVEFSPGRPIAWAMGGAELRDCSHLVQVAARAGVSTVKEPQAQRISDGAEIELVAIEEGDKKNKRLSTVRARISLDGGDLVVELIPLTKKKGDATASAPECSKDASPVAVLDKGDGKRRAINLPAQFRLKSASIRNGLTFEFRGGLRVGNDVSSGRQPLLTSGRLTFREVRRGWLQWLADAQFDIESRDLGLGDKVTIDAPSLDEIGDDAPRGFVRIVKGEKGPEMSVYATMVATDVAIVRPFSQPEIPKANMFRRVWADGLLSALLAFFFTLIPLYFGFVQFMLLKNK